MIKLHFPIIFVAHSHGFINDSAKMREFLEEYKPEFFLCEQVEDLKFETKEDFDKFYRQKKVSDMTEFHDVVNMVEYCQKNNIRIIGTDLHNFGIPQNIAKKISEKKPISEGEKFIVGMALQERSGKQIETIKEYLKKTNRPIVVSVGSWHLRENSDLRNAFDYYKICYLADNDGKVIISPPQKGDKVFWREVEVF